MQPVNPLPAPKGEYTLFKEIAVTQQPDIADVFTTLTPAERVMSYYLWRASLSGNSIGLDQRTRYGVLLKDIFVTLYKNQEVLEPIFGEKFTDQVRIFLVYIITNHGQYFIREQAHNKRTPSSLDFHELTLEHVTRALEIVDPELLKRAGSLLPDIVFNKEYEPTLTVTGSIDKSAVNIYSRDFTNQDYQKLTPEQKSRVNGYYYKENNTPCMGVYSVQDRYSKELLVAVYWFKKALEHARNYPQYFDLYFVESLEWLIKYLETGDEEYFKKHSIAWLKSNNRVSYTYGFIETYVDPMEGTGEFQAEVLVRAYDLDTFVALLPDLEAQMPLPEEFKRVNRASLPKATIEAQLVGTGGMGPLKNTLAYCLPNYNEIRSTVGTKQIMYPQDMGYAAQKDPEGYRILSYLPEKAAWLEKHDPDFTLIKSIEMLQTILHETLGHGSGALTEHIFKEGDNLIIGNKTYTIGDKIPVTSENLSEFLGAYEGTLEELRAEIIALYISLTYVDLFKKNNFLSDLAQKFDTRTLQELLLTQMAEAGLRRLLSQPDDATELTGHYMWANGAILYYLVDHGGLEIKKQTVMYKNKQHTVAGIVIKDFDKSLKLITELMQLVQRGKSMGDGQLVRELIETYGRSFRDPELLKIMKDKERFLVGDIKATAYIYPDLEPIGDEKTGVIQDVQATWPDDIIEQRLKWDDLALMKS